MILVYFKLSLFTINSLHLDNGVSFLLQSKIKSFEGDEKKIKKIKFYDGV